MMLFFLTLLWTIPLGYVFGQVLHLNVFDNLLFRFGFGVLGVLITGFLIGKDGL